MGDPKKRKKKYARPNHPWQKWRIEEEKVLTTEYCFKNKKEIWRSKSFLRHLQQQAKKIIASSGKQSEKESEQLLKRLHRLGLLSPQSKIEDVLNLTLKKIVERRLQTFVYRKKLAKSMKQARQFIVHRHIAIGGKIITSPSYMVRIEDEEVINFVERSPLASADHPERIVIKETKIPKRKADEKKIEESVIGEDTNKVEV